MPLGRLLDDAYDDFTEDDWEHALGGIHVLLPGGGSLIGHVAVMPRHLFHDGPEHRRRTATSSVLPTPASPELDLYGSIACDWRSGDVR